jgi:broad specificity phosphatase PhoE
MFPKVGPLVSRVVGTGAVAAGLWYFVRGDAKLGTAGTPSPFNVFPPKPSGHGVSPLKPLERLEFSGVAVEGIPLFVRKSVIPVVEAVRAVGQDDLSHLDAKTRLYIQWSLANPEAEGAWGLRKVMETVLAEKLSETQVAELTTQWNAQYGEGASFKERPENAGRVFLRGYKSIDEVLALVQEVRDRAGIDIDLHTGRMSYSKDFTPLRFVPSVLAIRHGETSTNVEPRGYQGNVDEPKNQLTEKGLLQASQAVEKLRESLGSTVPTAIYSSPLGRARATIQPYADVYGKEVHTEPMLREMSFGDVDNQHLWDVGKHGPQPKTQTHHPEYGTPYLAPSNPCHLFYLEQNALWRAKGGESFAQNILRAVDFVEEMNRRHGPSETIVVSSHSMFLAAVTAVTGIAKTVKEKEGCIGFDGHAIIKHAEPFWMPKATPEHSSPR